MNDITVMPINGELRTDSRLLAGKLDHRHRTILENIDKYQAQFKELGRLPFETGTLETAGGRQSQRFALLNEDQCYFLLTLMRNNQHVVSSKLSLVKAFRDARAAIAERDIARLDGKEVRKLETQAIALLVDYATDRGSKNAGMYYANITKMTNNILGIQSGQRDELESSKLKQIKAIETVVDIAIRDGLAAGLEYRDIYKLAKSRALVCAPALGVSS